MDTQKRLEAARHRFGRSLVGCWSEAHYDGFNMVMNQIWEIRSDGTGQFINTGAFGYPKSKMQFKWLQSEEFVFNLQLTEYIRYDLEENFALDDEDKIWNVIRYDFIAIPSEDYMINAGLIDVAQVGRKFCGFYESFAPLVYGKSLNKEPLDGVM